MRDLGQRIARTEAAFFSSHDQGLAAARAAFGTLPHQSLAALSSQERGIGEARLRLDAAPRRGIEDAKGAVAEQSRWLGDGIGRQLADHERDYRHATHRLLSVVKTAYATRPGEQRDRLAEVRRLCRERIGHRLGTARQSIHHTAALIEARDLRRHGYVLANDPTGRPVSSIADAPVGARLELKFRDGEAQVSVEKTKETKR